MPDETRALAPALDDTGWDALAIRAEKGLAQVEGYDIEIVPNSTEDDAFSYLRFPAHPLMALANAALPDGDPRKITREDVAALEGTFSLFFTDDSRPQLGDQGVTQSLIDTWDTETRRRQLAEKLRALLPPEG